MCYTPVIFYNIFRWEFFLESDISMFSISTYPVNSIAKEMFGPRYIGDDFC
jgi:hypothetical protein